MHCSTCGARLVAERRGPSVHYRCPRCEGRLVRLDALRRVLGARETATLIARTVALPERAHRDCPACRAPMQARGTGAAGEVELDVCEHCRLLWADRGELRAMAALAHPRLLGRRAVPTPGGY